MISSIRRVLGKKKEALTSTPLPQRRVLGKPKQEPIITPATKAEEGHDEDISRDAIIAKGLVSEENYVQLEKFALALFRKGTEMAAERGLILVDTKYEFGEKDGVIYLIDEVHTPDSSRYFFIEGYEENLAANLPQKQLSKEFVREWLIANNFQGKDGQSVPEMTDEKVLEISNRYIELYENVSGEKFVAQSGEDAIGRIESNIKLYFGI
jgi:phosphoribosylaminoimidazole-succinocarboxamide synthase